MPCVMDNVSGINTRVTKAGRASSMDAKSIFAIDWLLTVASVGGIRVSVRLISETVARTPAFPAGARRVLVVGAGDAGALVVREMQKNPHLAMTPIGFLDDEAAKTGKRIHNVRVLGSIASLEAVVEQQAVAEVIVAMPKAPGAVVRSILESSQRAGITARALPGMFELIEGGVSVSRLRQIEIADLLRRRPIVLEPEAGLYLQNQVVLITGAGGSIGSELCRQVARAQARELILVGHGENSIFEIDQRDDGSRTKRMFDQLGYLIETQFEVEKSVDGNFVRSV